MDYEPPTKRPKKNRDKGPYSTKHVRYVEALKERKAVKVPTPQKN